VTVDDSQWAAAIVPGITVVARPVEQLGRIAVQKLIAEIEDGVAQAEKIVLRTELIARESIANLILRPELNPDFRE
jgi:DNA-binding LacI/PurR family transcriptional regulator